jgi:hypothetical protein
MQDSEKPRHKVMPGVQVDDELWWAVKKEAVERRITVTALVASALKKEISYKK